MNLALSVLHSVHECHRCSTSPSISWGCIVMSLEETLRRIERKLEAIEAEMREMKQWIIRNNLTETSLIELPDHLRKTAMGLLKIRQGTAGEVSKYTKRTRAVESGYLNQLERQGLVTSSKEGRRKVFALHSDFAVRSPARDHQ